MANKKIKIKDVIVLKSIKINRKKICCLSVLLMLVTVGIADCVYEIDMHVVDEISNNDTRKTASIITESSENNLSASEVNETEYDFAELKQDELNNEIVEGNYSESDNQNQVVTSLDNNNVNSASNTTASTASNTSVNTDVHTCNWISKTVVTKEAYTYQEDVLEYTKGMYFQSVDYWMSYDEAKTVDVAFNKMLSEVDYPTCLDKVDFTGMQKYSALQKALTLSLKYSSQWWTDHRMIVVGTETITVPAETKVIQECSTCGKTK